MSTGPLVDYRRTGGIAGLEDRLLIETSGRATLTRKTARSEFVLDRSVVDGLAKRLDEADFARLESEYRPPRKGSDLFEYVITYRGKTVRAVDTAVPESLWPALELLNRVVDTGGKP